jgi:hypothetical protein
MPVTLDFFSKFTRPLAVTLCYTMLFLPRLNCLLALSCYKFIKNILFTLSIVLCVTYSELFTSAECYVRFPIQPYPKGERWTLFRM